MDFLTNRMAMRIRELYVYDGEHLSEFADNVKKAFESEVFMSTGGKEFNGTKNCMELYTDKSVKYVKAYLQMAAYTCKDRKKVDICAESVGILFWLTDDLCDVFEDLRDGVCNSIIVNEMRHDCNIEHAVDSLINNLGFYMNEIRKALKLLKENVGSELYDFILWEVSDWFDNISRRLKE